MKQVTSYSVLSDGVSVRVRLTCGHVVDERGKWRYIDGWWLKEPVRRRCPVCEPAAAPSPAHVPSEDLGTGLNPS